MMQLFSAVLVLSVVPASGSPEVMEEEVTLSCCGSPMLTFSEDCKIQWAINEESFATFKKGDMQCTFPCKKMEGGRMSLDSCLSLNATVVCSDSGQVKEKSIKYLHKECSSRSDARARGHLVSSVLVLLAVIIAGLMVK